MTFSVVIPTLNEAESLPATLSAVSRAQAAGNALGQTAGIVVSDGGSTDATCALALSVDARVLRGAAGRGRQVAAGIHATDGDVVVLVHADTWLPETAFAAMATALRDPQVVGGGFRKRFREGPPLLRFGAGLRSALFFALSGRLFGDQAIFARRSALEAAGGMPEWPLMEDFELCRRLRTVGRLALLRDEVWTSGRRFSEQGTIRMWWRMAGVMLGHSRGATPEESLRRYQGR
jgi:rSAM/selenodomain-associated transferase 2